MENKFVKIGNNATRQVVYGEKGKKYFYLGEDEDYDSIEFDDDDDYINSTGEFKVENGEMLINYMNDYDEVGDSDYFPMNTLKEIEKAVLKHNKGLKNGN